MKKLSNSILVCVIAALVLSSVLIAQEPYRRGTTAGNFLEIGYGSRGSAMGDAAVASANDLESFMYNDVYGIVVTPYNADDAAMTLAA